MKKMFIMLIVCICGNNFARLSLGFRLASARLPLGGGRSPPRAERGGTKWSLSGARGGARAKRSVAQCVALRSPREP